MMLFSPIKDTIASVIIYRRCISKTKLLLDLTKFLGNLTISALAKILFSVSVNWRIHRHL